MAEEDVARGDGETLEAVEEEETGIMVKEGYSGL